MYPSYTGKVYLLSQTCSKAIQPSAGCSKVEGSCPDKTIPKLCKLSKWCGIRAPLWRYKDLKAFMTDLKEVYADVDENAALDVLDTFSEHLNMKYPKISNSCRDN